MNVKCMKSLVFYLCTKSFTLHYITQKPRVRGWVRGRFRVPVFILSRWVRNLRLLAFEALFVTLKQTFYAYETVLLMISITVRKYVYVMVVSQYVWPLNPHRQ